MKIGLYVIGHGKNLMVFEPPHIEIVRDLATELDRSMMSQYRKEVKYKNFYTRDIPYQIRRQFNDLFLCQWARDTRLMFYDIEDD